MKKILIINQYAGNKGDRAVLFALCKLLISNANKIEIKVATSNPSLWKGYEFYSKNNIEFIPSAWDYQRVGGRWNRFFYWVLEKFKKYTFTIIRENYLSINLPIERLFSNPTFYSAAKKSDLIISTGGHHYTTILSRDMVCDLPLELCIAQKLNRNTVLFSQSIGPFDFYNLRNKKYITKLLNNCRSIYIREVFSKKYLQEINVSLDHVTMVPETVISLNRLFQTYTAPSLREKKVGVSIYSTKKRNAFERKNYVNCIAQFCNYLIDSGFKVDFFPMELKGTEPDDRMMICEILDLIKEKSCCYVHNTDLETEEHIIEVSKCRFFIGHKTHSVVFALTSGTPLIAIEYHPKTREFMSQFGFENLSISDDMLEIVLLKEKFHELLSNDDSMGHSCFQHAQKSSEIVDLNIKRVIS